MAGFNCTYQARIMAMQFPFPRICCSFEVPIKQPRSFTPEPALKRPGSVCVIPVTQSNLVSRTKTEDSATLWDLIEAITS